jgi:hypothetical protein
MGKSSQVLSHTQGIAPIVVRWSDVLRTLHQLPVPSDGRQLGPREMVAPYFLSDAFVGNDCLLALYLN